MDVLAPLRQLSAWFSRQSRTVKDLIVIGFVVLPIFVAAVWYDAFDRFLQLTKDGVAAGGHGHVLGEI